MQRRIRMVVEERRIARDESPQPPSDVEKTVEIPPQALRAIGRVQVQAI
jgi:hypothetical protein